MSPTRIAAWACLALALAALLAPWIAPFDPDRTSLLARMRPPAPLSGYWANLLGTDALGRDLLSRCLHGLRASLGIAVFGSLIGAAAGTAIGLLAGTLRGRTDAALMLLVDVQLALPYLLIVLVGLAVFGTGIEVLIPLISLAGWEYYARLVRGQVLVLRAQPFVEAAREAFLQARFTPGERQGVPVKSRIDVEVRFDDRETAPLEAAQQPQAPAGIDRSV